MPGSLFSFEKKGNNLRRWYMGFWMWKGFCHWWLTTAFLSHCLSYFFFNFLNSHPTWKPLQDFTCQTSTEDTDYTLTVQFHPWVRLVLILTSSDLLQQMEQTTWRSVSDGSMWSKEPIPLVSYCKLCKNEMGGAWAKAINPIQPRPSQFHIVRSRMC